MAQTSLDEAVEAYEDGELDRALGQFEQALQSGYYQGPNLAQIYLHLGILYGARGEMPAAHDAFENALALAPELEAPPELGPELRARFEEIRASREAGPLSLELEVTAPDGKNDGLWQAHASAHGAPNRFVDSFRLRAGPPDSEPRWSTTVQPQDANDVAIPEQAWSDSGRLVVKAEARDSHGATLARDRAQVGRAPADSPPTAPTPEPRANVIPTSAASSSQTVSARDDDAIWKSPWLWTGVGVAVVGAVLSGVLLSTRDSRYVVGAPELE